MKDSVLLDGKIYISSRRAAEISHYTTDYVGQLCRAGKIDCRIVGRAWFVTEESVLAHQKLMANSLTNGFSHPSNLLGQSNLSSQSSQKNFPGTVPVSTNASSISVTPSPIIPSVFSLRDSIDTKPIHCVDDSSDGPLAKKVSYKKYSRDEPSRLVETKIKRHFFRTVTATTLAVISLILLAGTIRQNDPQLADTVTSAIGIPVSHIMDNFVTPVVEPITSTIGNAVEKTSIPVDYASISDAFVYGWNGMISGISSSISAVLNFGTVTGGQSSPIIAGGSNNQIASTAINATSTIIFDRTSAGTPIVTNKVTNNTSTFYVTDPSVAITLSSLQNQINAEKSFLSTQVDSLAENLGRSSVVVSSGSSGSASGSGADLNDLDASNISSGVLAVSYGGTGLTSVSSSAFMLSNSSSNPYWGTTTPAFTLGGTVTGNNENLTGLNELSAISVSASTSLALPYLAGFGSVQCLQVDTNGVVSATGSACGNGGGGSVNTVSNSDGTLTISPTTGSVVASLNLSHANTWLGAQTFNATTTLATTTATTLSVGSLNGLLFGTNGVVSAISTSSVCPSCITGNQNITLSGDISGSGTTSINTTLATVNSNVGSFGSSTAIPNFTVNAKGLITAAGTSSVIAPAGTLTGTTLASNVITSSLTSVGILTSGSIGSGFGIIGLANGGTGTSTASANDLLIANSSGTGWTEISTSSLGFLTTNVAEGTNLYYTTARAQTDARTAISVSGLPLTYSSGIIGINQASTTGAGYLSSADWNTFNNKASTTVANSWTALQTFGNNISFGGAQLSVSALSSGQFLKYNGSNWINVAIATSDVSGLGSLATLSSVNNSNWSGTPLAVGNGGTGTTTAIANNLLIGNASGTGWTEVGTSSLGLLSATVIGSGLTGQIPYYASNGTTLTATSAIYISTTTGNVGIGNLTTTNITTTNASSTNFTSSGNSYLGTILAGTWNASILGSNYGGAGSVSGILKANGSGVVSAASAGSDYLAPNGNGSALTNLSASALSGVVAVANGGTGFSSASTSSFFLTNSSGNPYTGTTTPAFTLGGTVTGNNQNITGLGLLSSTGATFTNATTTNATSTNLFVTNLTTSGVINFSGIIGTTSCLQVNASGTVSGTGTSCGSGGGGGAVNTVSNVDGTLTVSPITGAVVTSLNLAHTNSWTGAQTFNATTTLATTTATALSATTLSISGSTTLASSLNGLLFSTNGLVSSLATSSLTILNGLTTATSLSSVGTLTSGSIASGFGNINIGSNTFTGNGSGLTNISTSSLVGVLGMANGGTGTSTASANDLLIANSSGTGWTEISTSSLGFLTTNVAEGTNLYYTTARAQTDARTAISVSGLPLTYSSGIIGINQASTTGAGYLSSADWNTFNNKASTTVANSWTALQTFSNGFISNASSTITLLTIGNSTTTNATTTNLAVTGSTTLASSLNGLLFSTNGLVSSLATSSITNLSNLTTVGTLTSGSIASGFGNINIGSNTFTGNGSGLTNLNVANVSSGVLAVANGGTGLSSASTSAFFLTNSSGTPYWGTTTPAFTLGGTVTGNNQNLTGLNLLTGTGATFTNATTSSFVATSTLDVGTSTTLSGNQLSVVGNQEIYSATPQLIGSLATSSFLGAGWVRVVGRYAYMTGDSTAAHGNSNSDNLSIIDIQDPANPKLVSQISTAQTKSAEGLEVVGKYAYLVGMTNNDLDVIDISNPNVPAQVGFVSSSTALADAEGIAVSGKYAYVVGDGLSTGPFTVVDISDPANPFVVSTISSSDLHGACMVIVKGKYAYVDACNSGKLLAIDISNPYAPIITGKTTNIGADGVYVQGKYAYVLETTKLAVVDVSNPLSNTMPTVGSVTVSGSPNLWTIKVAGKFAYVTNLVTNGNLLTFDISSSTNPFLVSSSSVLTNNPDDVFIDGDYAYVTGNGTGALDILRISGLNTSGANIGNLYSEDANISNNLVIGQNLYVQNGINTGLQGILSQGPGFFSQQLSVEGSSTSNNLIPFSVSNINSSGATSTLFEVNSSGFVGIGTTTPGSNLTVSGDTFITGNATSTNLTATGTLNVSGTTTLASSLNGLLFSTNGLVSSLATSSLTILNGLTTATSLSSVGTLTSGSIASGFGNINIGSNTFTGNGSGLTNLNVANVSSGVLAVANGGTGLSSASTSAFFLTNSSGTPYWGTTTPAFTLGGTVTGNNQNLTGLNLLTGTGATFTNATTTNATSTNLYTTNHTTINLIATNATTTTFAVTGSGTTTFTGGIISTCFATTTSGPCITGGGGVSLSGTNTWTGQQTFSTLAPIFSTETAGSIFFAGAGGLLSQNNSDFFWDNTNNALDIGTNLAGIAGNVNAGVLNVFGTTTSTTNLALFRANVNNYAQVAVVNANAGATSSADFIVGNNLNDINPTSYYGDFGINSSGNADANYTGLLPNDTYLFSSDGGLDLGTATSSASSTIKFFTGGLLAADQRLVITSQGFIGIGTTSPSNALEVNGNGYFAGNFGIGTTTGTTTIASNLQVNYGSLAYDVPSGVTNIDALQTGALNFDTDAGAVSWADLPLDSTPTQGTIESMSAQVGDTPILTVYGESNGSGGVQNTRVGIGTTTPLGSLVIEGMGTDNPLIVASSSGTTYFSISSAGTSTFSGYVGIGTTTPSQALTVVGDTFITGNATSSNLTATGTLTVLGTTTLASSLTGFLQATAGVVSATSSISLTTNVSGILPVANGGTSLSTTANSAFLITNGSGVPSWATTTPAFTLGGTITGNNQNITGLNQIFGTQETIGTTTAYGALSIQQAFGATTPLFSISSTTSAGFATSSLFTVLANGFIGIGSSTPSNALEVNGNGYFAGNFGIGTTTGTTTIASNLQVNYGSLAYDVPSGVTNIDALQTGALNFDTDAGQVSFADLPIDSTPIAGTIESYTENIGGSPILTIYGEANGSGAVQNTRIGIGTTSPIASLDISGMGIDSPLIVASSSGTTYFSISQAGTSTFTGNVLPSVDNTYQLGATTTRWSAIYASTTYAHTSVVGDVVFGNNFDLLEVKNPDGTFATTTGAGMVWENGIGTPMFSLDAGGDLAVNGSIIAGGDVCALGTFGAGSSSQCLGSAWDNLNALTSQVSALSSTTVLLGNVNTTLGTQVSGLVMASTSIADLAAQITNLNTQVATLTSFASSTTVWLSATSTITSLADELASSSIFASTTATTLASSTSFIQSIANAVISILQSSGQVITSAGNWVVNQITATVGIFTTKIQTPLVQAPLVQSSRLETQTAAVSNGIEMTDSSSGSIYCVRMTDGELTSTLGACPTTASSTTTTTSTTTPSVSTITTSTIPTTSIITTTDVTDSSSSTTTPAVSATTTIFDTAATSTASDSQAVSTTTVLTTMTVDSLTTSTTTSLASPDTTSSATTTQASPVTTAPASAPTPVTSPAIVPASSDASSTGD